MVAMCGYHGMHDWSIGTTENNRGVPQVVAELTKTYEYNDADSLRELFSKYPGQIGTIIIEPIQRNGPVDGFLQELRRIADQKEAVLIFDEVVSGFRYAKGGASEFYRVIPDLASIGKGMANGMPLSAVVGRADILDLIEKEHVFISTTFGGEALSLAAAIEAIDIMAKGYVEHIWEMGTQMLTGLRRISKQPYFTSFVQVVGLPPHCGIVFQNKDSVSHNEIMALFQVCMIG